MSYDIYIGETVWVQDEREGDTTSQPRVLGRTLREAPAFPNDPLSHHHNSRHPGYSNWSEFCRMTGLYALFFNGETGLMREHPGYAPITQDHYEQVCLSLAAWRKRYPNAIPGFDNMGDDGEFTDAYGEGGANLARLMWLEWWMRWALAHCGHPAIYNS